MDERMEEFIKRQMREEDMIPDIVIEVEGKENILHVLTQLDRLQEDAENGKYYSSRYKFWDMIHEMYPTTKGHQCKINTTKPTELTIEVYHKHN